MAILDEATAHLDSRLEVTLADALAGALPGRTVLVIAHRLSTIQAAGLILVLEGGRIVERGRHLELLTAGGRYEKLYRTQVEVTPALKGSQLGTMLRADVFIAPECGSA